MKLLPSDASSLLQSIKIDIDKPESISSQTLKRYSLTKPKIKVIHKHLVALVKELSNQIDLTIRSYNKDFGKTAFQRLLLSGGGSSVKGVESFLSDHLGIPSQRHDFPIAVGMALSHMTHGKKTIDFMKGDFAADRSFSIKSVYALPIAFSVIACTILIIYAITSFLFRTVEASDYHAVLNQKYQEFFHSSPSESDPVESAKILVEKEKKELSAITSAIPVGASILASLEDVVKPFPGDPSFNLKNIVIDNEVIRIDGEASSSGNIDSYKNKLLESKLFDSVTLNTSTTRRDLVTFSMVIKLKNKKKSEGTAQ